jgi:hypothetical protein
MVKKTPKLDYISPGDESYSIAELLNAVQRKTKELCEKKCGKYPTKQDECTGLKDGTYVCKVRRISDDAYFHVERGWTSLLKKDFFKLVEITIKKISHTHG